MTEGVSHSFMKNLQTFLFGQLCLDALQESKIEIKDLKMSIIWPL